MQQSLEILAPARDEACLEAALCAGADAVYFGLDAGFNARARAPSIALTDLTRIMDRVHDSGRRGYLTLNTLVFDDELERVEQLVRAAAAAGVDAVIVQDLAVMHLIRRIAPSLRQHASTQTTCTDKAGIELLASLGAERITLARELSLKEVAALAVESPVELEVFAHGAICIAYSGQCLTSEAIGGRSANRGACAQACRLPYELVVDGVRRDLGEVAYLLSPRDLDTSAMVPELLASGVRAIKIEGRLKDPDYVRATTLLYRRAVDAAFESEGSRRGTPDDRASSESRGGASELAELREFSAQAFSRGGSTGFLGGIDHQALVDGTTCDHVGVEIGTCRGLVRDGGREWVRLELNRDLARGDGILVMGQRAGENEFGGRVWQLRCRGREIERTEGVREVLVWLGPEGRVRADGTGRRVFRTSRGTAAADLDARVPREPTRLVVDVLLSGKMGECPKLSLRAEDGRAVEVTLEHPLEPARQRPLDTAAIREKLERLGDTRYRLGQLEVRIPDGSTLPISDLNRARREAATHLRIAAHREYRCGDSSAVASESDGPKKAIPPAGLFVTCRSAAQAQAALEARADGVYLDLLALTGLGPLLRQLRVDYTSATLGVALPRVRKAGEEKIDSYIRSLGPDSILVRSLGSLGTLGTGASAQPGTQPSVADPCLVADFSLNAVNRLTALELLARPLAAFTPGYDLDAAQLLRLLDSPLAPYAEVVIHHPMPLFYMEHCVFAALLSDGHDHRDCGRPCERHVVSLRDRKGVDLPLEADVTCRNTVFHGIAQSAADLVPQLAKLGVRRYRVELVREDFEQARAVVEGYRELLAQGASADETRARLSARGLRVVRGSLRVVG